MIQSDDPVQLSKMNSSLIQFRIIITHGLEFSTAVALNGISFKEVQRTMSLQRLLENKSIQFMYQFMNTTIKMYSFVTFTALPRLGFINDRIKLLNAKLMVSLGKTMKVTLTCFFFCLLTCIVNLSLLCGQLHASQKSYLSTFFPHTFCAESHCECNT